MYIEGKITKQKYCADIKNKVVYSDLNVQHIFCHFIFILPGWIYVAMSVFVWITRVVTDIWCKIYVSCYIWNIFTQYNVDMFSSYLLHCMSTS